MPPQWLTVVSSVSLIVSVGSGALVAADIMQIAMTIGFATNYPMNAFLIRAGIKEAM